MDPNGPAPQGRSRQPESRLPEFVSRLRAAGWEPTAEEIAEALWFARWADHSTGEAEPADAVPEEDGSDAPRQEDPARRRRPSATRGRGEPPSRTGAVTERLPSVSTVSLYAPDRHGGGAGGAGTAFPVRAPAATTLPGLLEFQRRMRPLLGYRPPLRAVETVLDEAASAELSARSGAVRPVFGPSPRPDAELLLLMDASATNSVWQLTFDKLRQTCERLGAFRDVQALYLHRGADGTPFVGTGPDPKTTRLRPADQYRNTTGRRLTLIVSDCVGSLWQDGRAQRLLHRWLRSAPSAVVQPLPPRLWRRTALPGEPGLLIRDKGAGGPVTFEPDGYGPPPADDALPVPVLLPTPAALGSWARLQGGEGRQTVRGAAAWVRPRHHAMPPPTSPRRGEPREMLAAFRASASPGALDLAVHLAAVPLLLPVIQLVQEAMLPDTGPMELAEVLLSGLLERLPDVEDSPGPRYDFVHGVQELLLHSLDQGAAELVLKHLSEYVTRRFGNGTRNFPAMAVARLGNRPVGDVAEEDLRAYPPDVPDELFAQIPARVVRQYIPDPETAPDDISQAELLLRRWRAQADPWLLDEARRHAESAVEAAGPAAAAGAAADGDAPARPRRVLGQVLHAMTKTGPVRRNPKRVRELLHEAAYVLTASTAAGDEAAAGIELAAVRYDLWKAEAAAGHLHSAVRTLRAMEERIRHRADGALREHLEAERRIWLGKALLELSRAGETAEQGAPSYEVQAADELGAAAELLTAGGSRGRRLCEALLDRGAALRRAGAEVGERLANLDRAEAAATGDAELRLRCARERARVHRDSGRRSAAEAAYAEAETYTGRYSSQRAELLTEWGVMLLRADDEPATAEGEPEAEAAAPEAVGTSPGSRAGRAEGLLREALTTAPADGALAGRLQLLLGGALVDRFERGGFRPDLYEGCHMLEQAARKAPEGELRADAWLLLGKALDSFQDGGADRAAEAFSKSADEARQVRGGAAGAVAVARALMGRAKVNERRSHHGEALADYRAAREEWQQLTGRLADDIPWDEVRETIERLAALEGR
ncbi:tetratricopeptide repeat protein [Streptomyces sp. HNM0575]|uniref:SAV_2336 N-terminal domain-related protein n=1 Tax=Streptomyces sp. HNM0575 TaxID=2716338 RepID=UPI00145CCFB6|nr:SAV_2336 N-terminal domain-related protein [Streptomyces sp. HNM0575]NLU71969.1 tetratricopeptide repeat protein [Streptomyces sp. HNM0575]